MFLNSKEPFERQRPRGMRGDLGTTRRPESFLLQLRVEDDSRSGFAWSPRCSGST